MRKVFIFVVIPVLIAWIITISTKSLDWVDFRISFLLWLFSYLTIGIGSLFVVTRLAIVKSIYTSLISSICQSALFFFMCIYAVSDTRFLSVGEMIYGALGLQGHLQIIFLTLWWSFYTFIILLFCSKLDDCARLNKSRQ